MIYICSNWNSSIQPLRCSMAFCQVWLYKYQVGFLKLKWMKKKEVDQVLIILFLWQSEWMADWGIDKRKPKVSSNSYILLGHQNLSFANEELISKTWWNPFLVLLRKMGFFDRIYTHVYGKTKFRFKTKMYLQELSGPKFHSVTSSNVTLYNDVKNSIFTKSGFIRFWK